MSSVDVHDTAKQRWFEWRRLPLPFSLPFSPVLPVVRPGAAAARLSPARWLRNRGAGVEEDGDGTVTDACHEEKQCNCRFVLETLRLQPDLDWPPDDIEAAVSATTIRTAGADGGAGGVGDGVSGGSAGGEVLTTPATASTR